MNSKSTDDLAKILWDFNSLYNQIKKVDCIFVMGSHDVRVARRGAELFLQGFAPQIIFSGNVGKLTKGLWSNPEANVFADEAIRMGVPKASIIIEKESTNTGENILLTKKLLEQKNIAIASIIVVQKPFMQRRAYATMKKLWPIPELIITAPEITYEEYPNEVVSKEYLVSILVGDTQRIKVYAEKGFQIKQDMSNEVLEAYTELIKRGFTKHLIPQ